MHTQRNSKQKAGDSKDKDKDRQGGSLKGSENSPNSYSEQLKEAK